MGRVVVRIHVFTTLQPSDGSWYYMLIKSASLTRVFQQRWCQYSDLPCHSASEAAWNYTCTSREHWRSSMYASSVLTIIIQSISASGGIDSLTYGSTICQNCSHFCVCVQLVNQLYRRHSIYRGGGLLPISVIAGSVLINVLTVL